jgi:predicted ATPase/transcriptional regulator with XRE-family HTH domain
MRDSAVTKTVTVPSFPQLLRHYRKSLDLTQRDLAQRVGCTEDLIRKLEAGRRKPSRQLAGLLATQLNVPAQERAAFIALARAEPESQPATSSTTNSPPGNLPAAQTALFGRNADVARVVAKLIKPDVRLVTLTGTGGIGKTRLALEVARTVWPQFGDGAWFVALESAPAHSFVFDAIASVMGLAVKGDSLVKTQVIAAIGAKRILLVLDNFEHVLGATPDMHEMLATCPSVAVLVTSRERLKLRAEHVMLVKPLAVPDEEDDDVVMIAESPAVQLFVDRADMAVPEFEVTTANAAQLATLCRQLEGIPLAIELMAARASMYSLSALLEGLTSRLLSTRSELIDVPARQQSLWHAIEWSYRLLTNAEQRCFRRLAVLPGGASLEAAAALCDVPLLEQTLQSLLDKSLILRSEHTGVVRFHMHMPLREYGLGMLQAERQLQSAQRAAATYFAHTVGQLYGRYIEGAPDMDAHWRALELDLDNLRAAAQWADEAGDVVAFVRLSSAMRRFMWVRGHTAEGVRLAQRALALIEQANGLDEALHARLRADAFGTLGTYLMDVGDNMLGIIYLRTSADYARAQGYASRLISSLINLGNGLANTGAYDEATRVCEECADVCQRVGDTYGLADVHACLALVAFFQGKLAEARDEFLVALGMHRQIKNTSAELITMGNLGVVHEHMGEYGESLRYSEQSLSLARASGIQFLVAGITGNMAGLNIKLGNLVDARRYLSESLRVSQQVQELEYLANGFAMAAKIALLCEEPEHAATFLGMAYRAHRERNASFTPDNQGDVDEIRAAVGDAAVDAATAEQAAASLQAMTDQACVWLDAG